MSDYTLLLVPTEGCGNEGVTMVTAQSRHVSKVPVEDNPEVAFDTGLDPKSYDDHVSVAGALCRLVCVGKEFHMAKDRIRRCLNELDGILTDLRSSHMPPLTEETADVLFDSAISRVQEIGEAIGYKIEHREDD